MAARVPLSKALKRLIMLPPVALDLFCIEFGLLGFSLIVAKTCWRTTCYVVEICVFSPALVGETIEVVTSCVFNSREFDLPLFPNPVPDAPGVPDPIVPLEMLL